MIVSCVRLLHARSFAAGEARGQDEELDTLEDHRSTLAPFLSRMPLANAAASRKSAEGRVPARAGAGQAARCTAIDVDAAAWGPEGVAGGRRRLEVDGCGAGPAGPDARAGSRRLHCRRGADACARDGAPPAPKGMAGSRRRHARRELDAGGSGRATKECAAAWGPAHPEGLGGLARSDC